MSLLQGAVNTTFDNTTINNIGGNATIIKFDGDGPHLADLKAVFVDHLTGLTATTDLRHKLDKHILDQSVRNLPRANAAYNDYAVKHRKRVTCFENTRQSLRKEIGEWITTVLDKPEIYLLSGLAGIGKSTVAQTVAERADNLHLLGASFFFSRDEAELRDARKFYTTIAFQLCLYDKQFAQAIGNALLEERGAAATSKEPMEQLDALIVEPLRGMLDQRSRPLVMVVDALDECDEEDALVVLETLEHLVHELPSLRVVLTSRPQLLLDGYLDNHRVFHMHNIEDRIVDNDVRVYLKYRLSCDQVKSHLRLKTQWSASEEEIETLVRVAGRLFIIASTAVLFILDKAARNPGSQMKKLQSAFSHDRTPFNALNEFYTIILRSAVPIDCDHDIVQRYQDVIGTIIVVQDPLQIATLEKLIGLSSEDIRAVLDNLQSVILLGDDNIPRAYHKSFPDYVKDTTRCKDHDLQIVSRDQHTRITVCCFDVMNLLKRNILGVGTPAQYLENSDGLKEESINDRLCEKIPPELRYACIYWANHLKHADIKDINLIKQLDGFAKERLLYWLDALSWICKLELAHGALLAVHNLLTLSSSDTREILYDGFRFISKNYDRIRQSALHIYHSALPFTPTKIHLSNIFKKDDLCQLGDGQERWDALVAVPRHGAEHRCSHIAFSLDSSYLASWVGHETKLWDAKSGTPVKTFNGDKIALSGDFTIAALCKDNALALHDVASNASVATYNIPSAVVELALSFDGSRLAVGLSDGTVSLWDGRGGGPIERLDGYACENGRLEFSPTGYHLAFLSSGGGIWLRNGFNGKSIAHLIGGGSDKYAKFVFSHSGSRLVMLTQRNELKQWNGESRKHSSFHVYARWPLAISDDGCLIAAVTERQQGVQLHSWELPSFVGTVFCHGKTISSLSFSRDMLAISYAQTVTLYDFRTRAIIASVQSDSVIVRVALSPSRLAVMSDGCEVHLWEVQSMKASASESVKTPRIATILAFSPDCLRLACGFLDGAVELWDTGRRQQVMATIEPLIHSKTTTLAFSADGKKIAFGSTNGTVKLRSSKDGAPSGTLKRIFPTPVTSLAFSSRLLAAQTQDSLTIFDCKTFRPLHSFSEGGHHLASSFDGALLASYTSRGIVRLWNVKARTLHSLFHSGPIDIQKLVISPDGSRVAALTSLGFEFFDAINKHKITNPGHEEMSWIFQKGTLISQPSPNAPKEYGGYGEPLLGHFPEHHGGIPILWMPRDVGISAFTVESSTFALACTDGRLMIGSVPPALNT